MRDARKHGAMFATAWSGSRFIAVGSSGIFQTSADGVFWTGGPIGINVDLNGVTWVNNNFIAVGKHGKIFAIP